MSLADKLTKLSQNHQKTLAEHEANYNLNQTTSVLSEFEATSKRLGKRVKISGNSADMKTALTVLQNTYDAGNDIIKSSLKANLETMNKEYKTCLESEKKARVPLEVVLLWNSNNGDKELILPVLWDSKKSSKDAIAGKIYAAAHQAISDYDSNCIDREWNGFTKIVSSNIAGNKAENLPAKNDIIQMQTNAIHEYIMSMIGSELKEYNIELNIINSKIKTVNSKDYSNSQKTPEPKSKRISAGINVDDCIDDIVSVCNLIEVDAAAEILMLKRMSIFRKIKGKHLHGLAYGPNGKYLVPAHDLITYVFNFPKANPADTDADSRSNKHVSVMHELTADEFNEYKSEVGEVCDAQKTSEMIGITRNAIYSRINTGKMHGVRFDGQWYIPKTEIDLCKILYKTNDAKQSE